MRFLPGGSRLWEDDLTFEPIGLVQHLVIDLAPTESLLPLAFDKRSGLDGTLSFEQLCVCGGIGLSLFYPERNKRILVHVSDQKRTLVDVYEFVVIEGEVSIEYNALAGPGLRKAFYRGVFYPMDVDAIPLMEKFVDSGVINRTEE